MNNTHQMNDKMFNESSSIILLMCFIAASFPIYLRVIRCVKPEADGEIDETKLQHKTNENGKTISFWYIFLTLRNIRIEYYCNVMMMIIIIIRSQINAELSFGRIGAACKTCTMCLCVCVHCIELDEWWFYTILYLIKVDKRRHDDKFFESMKDRRAHMNASQNIWRLG